MRHRFLQLEYKGESHCKARIKAKFKKKQAIKTILESCLSQVSKLGPQAVCSLAWCKIPGLIVIERCLNFDFTK